MAKFKIGEIITVSKPYAYVLSDKYRGQRCDYCLKKQDILKRCSQCSFVFYCNKACQAKGWELHKPECKYLLKASLKPADKIRLCSLIIFKVKKRGKDQPCDDVHGRKVTFRTLESHSEEIKQAVFGGTGLILSLFMEGIKEFVGEENLPPPDEFIELVGKMKINQFGILEKLDKIGTGLFLGTSVFDHSCEPNAEYVFNGTSMIVRSKAEIERDISKVYVSYIDLLNLTKDRRENLMSQYFFLCQCRRCTSPVLDDLMTQILDRDYANDHVSQMNECLQLLENLKNKEAETSPFYTICVEKLVSLVHDDVLPDTNILKVKALFQIFRSNVRSGRKKEAVEFGTRLVKPYRLYYGSYHQILGFHLNFIAGLHHSLGQVEECVANLQEARKIFKVIYGEEHPVYQQLFGTYPLGTMLSHLEKLCITPNKSCV